MPKGYGRVTIARSRSQTHRLAAQDYYGSIPEGSLVLHHCDNPPCVKAKHLYFGDYHDNARDKMQRGRAVIGELHPRAKLTERDVLHARESHAAGGFSYQDLATAYGVVETTMRQAITGASWKHI